MEVTVEVIGDDSYQFDVTDQTYADILAEIGLSIHEVTVLVDGRPVPEDQPVQEEYMEVLRVISGG